MKKILTGIAVLIAVVIVTLIGMYVFVVQPFVVSGNSMSPSLPSGTNFLLDKMSYRQSDPKWGDVVVFTSTDSAKYQDMVFVGRIIAGPGDTVSIKDKHVYLNYRQLDESKYLDSSVVTLGSTYLPDDTQISIPKDYYFMLGDNRPYSNDSRTVGLIPKENIIGKLWRTY